MFLHLSVLLFTAWGVYPSMHWGRRAVCLGGCLPRGWCLPRGVSTWKLGGGCPGGVCPDTPDPEAYNPPGTRGRYTLPRTHRQIRPPPPTHRQTSHPQMTIEAVDTHLTGMHSCLITHLKTLHVNIIFNVKPVLSEPIYMALLGSTRCRYTVNSFSRLLNFSHKVFLKIVLKIL